MSTRSSLFSGTKSDFCLVCELQRHVRRCFTEQKSFEPTNIIRKLKCEFADDDDDTSDLSLLLLLLIQILTSAELLNIDIIE